MEDAESACQTPPSDTSTHQHVWNDVRYATDGILHRGEGLTNRFLLYMTDKITRVWWQPNGTYASSNIQEVSPFDGGSVTVWGAFRVIAGWIWSQFKAIAMGQYIRGTSWKPLSSLILTTMFKNNRKEGRKCFI